MQIRAKRRKNSFDFLLRKMKRELMVKAQRQFGNNMIWAVWKNFDCTVEILKNVCYDKKRDSPTWHGICAKCD